MSKSTDEFLDAKLVVTPVLVHNDEHTSYVTLRDYPTMVTKLRQLLDQQIREARIDEVNRIPNPAYIGNDGLRREPMQKYKAERIVTLNTKTAEEDK